MFASDVRSAGARKNVCPACDMLIYGRVADQLGGRVPALVCVCEGGRCVPGQICVLCYGWPELLG